MRPRVSRVVLLAALAGAVLVLGALGLKLKDPLLERWQISRLESGDPVERAGAVEWLRLRGSARAVPALLDELERMARARSGREAELTPGIFDSPPATALLEIMDRLPGDCSRKLAGLVTTRWTARVALSRLGTRAEAAVPELVRTLEGNSDVAWEVVPWILGGIGPPARSALSLILERIQKGEAGSVLLARVAGRIATGPDVPAIIDLLESSRPFVRRAALWAIERMGQRAEAAVPALEACLHDADEEVTRLATLALASVRKDQAR